MLSWSIPLILSLAGLGVRAGNVTFGNACNITHNHLSPDTKQFLSDCTATTYCNGSDNTCHHKGCRKDEFPFGYRLFSHEIPDRCDKGEFCPDEEDACQPLMAVGNVCQLNRDDQCAPPPNYNELSGPNNFNGSICLNYQCMYANATLGNACVIENTAYVGYQSGSGQAFFNIVSRGNCVNGLYCDALSLKCLKTMDIGEQCTADKECVTDNCLSTGVCGGVPNAAKHLPSGIYAAVAVCIIGLMAGILASLYILHRRHRAEEREKRAQYWREQEQFRQNIMQMREQARTSLLSLPWQSQPGSPRHGPSSLDRDYAASETSQTGLAQHAAPIQSSTLRNELSDSGLEDDPMEDWRAQQSLGQGGRQMPVRGMSKPGQGMMKRI